MQQVTVDIQDRRAVVGSMDYMRVPQFVVERLSHGSKLRSLCGSCTSLVREFLIMPYLCAAILPLHRRKFGFASLPAIFSLPQAPRLAAPRLCAGSYRAT
jgi:hypothetical protein